MPSNPFISVIMPTYNRADAIGLTLKHMAQQTLPLDQFEVIVVDDGSTDKTPEIVTGVAWPFTCSYLQQQNKGAAAARNLGAQKAYGEWLVFLDADMVTTPGFLEQHIRGLIDHAPGTLVIGRVRSWPPSRQFWHERVIDPESVGKDYGELSRKVPFYLAYSCNLSISRRCFLSLDGFDETFTAFEDTDLAYRAMQHGHDLWYQSTALAYHNHTLSLQQCFQKTQTYASQLVWMLNRHPELWECFPGVDELLPLMHKPPSLRLVWRRLRAIAFSSVWSRGLLYASLSCFERWEKCPRLTSILFWRLALGYRRVGFQKGIQLYGIAQ